MQPVTYGEKWITYHQCCLKVMRDRDGFFQNYDDPEKDRDVAADSALAYACELAERTSESLAPNHRLHH